MDTFISGANARLLLETQPNVLVVPSSAVQRGPQGLFAWTVAANNTAEPRTIEVGATAGELTVITTGLREGERVVTEGQYKLAPAGAAAAQPPRAASRTAARDRGGMSNRGASPI